MKGYKLTEPHIREINKSIRVTRSMGGGQSQPSRSGKGSNRQYIQITEALDDDFYKGVSVSYDSDSKGWLSNGLLSWGDVDANEPRLLVNDPVEVDDIVTAYPTRDTDNKPLWVGVSGGGGEAQKPVMIKIKSGTGQEYIGDIVNNPNNEDPLELDVVLFAPQVSLTTQLPIGSTWYSGYSAEISNGDDPETFTTNYYIYPPVVS